MDSKDDKITKYSIAIAGINNAGKSSFVQRLTKNDFSGDIQSTLGMDVAFIKKNDKSIQLFDLGGQSVFRRLIWQNYIHLSQGIIYIFDSADPSTIDESKSWFWQIVDKWTSEKIPIIFLANKWDIDNRLELKDIIKRLELNKLSEKYNVRSFKIYDCSVKTGYNINEAFDWLVEKITKKLGDKGISLHNIYLSTQNGLPIASVNFGEIESSSTLMSSFFSVIDILSSQVMEEESGLESFKTESYQIIMIKKERILCTLRINADDSTQIAKLIAEKVIDFTKTNLKKTGEHRTQNEALKSFVENNFSDYVLYNSDKNR